MRGWLASSCFPPPQNNLPLGLGFGLIFFFPEISRYRWQDVRDVTRSGKGQIRPGCCGAGRASVRVPVSRGNTTSILGGIPCVLEAGGCLEALAAGKGFGWERGGTEMWQGAQGSYKGKGSSPGVIWIHFQMGLRYKSHLPGDLRRPSGSFRSKGSWGTWLAMLRLNTTRERELRD